MAGLSEIEVLSPGTLSSVQDWPGRAGFWEVGVPPSGPIDDRSLRVANRLVGNPEGAAGLEVTLTGPRLRFGRAATVAVTGATIPVKLDGEPVDRWQPFDVPAGGVLALGAIRAAGLRAYVAVRGGIDTTPVMGSRSVFVAGRLGGAALQRGDRLPLGQPTDDGCAAAEGDGADGGLAGLVAVLGNSVVLRVVLGPHGAPDFVTPAGLDGLFAADWTVHHQSDRTGIRLVGPQPEWARTDGGEAGLHPSNILDSAYGVGTVMLAGDMAVIVGPDGPSLGGFAAVAQVIRADRWRIGQLRAGDAVRLEPVDADRAAALHAAAESELAGLTCPTPRAPSPGGRVAAPASPAASVASVAPAAPVATAASVAPVASVAPAAPVARSGGGRPEFDRPLDGVHGLVTYRRAGECAVLVEFGDPVIDLRSRVRANDLAQALVAESIDGIRDLTPGVRSLHVQHDTARLATDAVLGILAGLEASLPPPEAVAVPGRIVHLPLAWRHSLAERAVERYATSIRPDAPWCPDNIDFIRRINGLADERAVQEIVTQASYLVLGLGDVYLGAPVAVPLDPRHRLVTTKYTPARTWTPANAVGIGGAFLCVYGMEGPGGYQLVGRTVPIWDTNEAPPWRLRHFDQLRFDLVSEVELEDVRAASEAGEWRPRIEPAEFSLVDHDRFVTEHAVEIASFTRRREAAFAAERRAWAAAAEPAGELVA
ncbi:MAG TPA: 5-oxoprolinase/urea amidolyase family protein [Solirubrobacteraceae bacterium]|nr:5-oxoprolinase/urea amidolyase family protein [Solirubrobacteraceae bacterium]